MSIIDEFLAQEELSEELDQKLKLNKEREKEAFEWCLNDIRGRRVFRAILRMTGVDSSVTTSDVGVMQVLSGRRDVGLQIANRLREIDFSKFQLMQKEEFNDE